MIEYIIIKMPQGDVPKYSNSVKIFAGMNIEEYLYNLKFEEIADKVSEVKRKKLNKILLISAAVLGFAGILYISFSQFM